MYPLRRLLQLGLTQHTEHKYRCLFQSVRRHSELPTTKLAAGIHLLDRFYQSAQNGDVDTLVHMIPEVGNIDIPNKLGWTALMFAAQAGHIEVIKELQRRGCNMTWANKTGQTAEDIAVFWNHQPAADLLHVPQVCVEKHVRNYYAGNALDRSQELRLSSEWLGNAMKDPRAVYVLFHNLEPVVIPLDRWERTGGKKYTLCQFRYEDVCHVGKLPTIFLGVDRRRLMRNAHEEEKTKRWFAIDISDLDQDVKDLNPNATILQVYPGLLQMNKQDASVIAQARSLLDWHVRYTHCPWCGSESYKRDAGYRRTCSNKDCKSHKGIHNLNYPRVDPTIISMVVSPDRKKCLLGRQSRFPPGMWSCLAGFVEPGEGIEDACKREIEEEIGVELEKVEYHSSQPWPMPSVLMLGFMSIAKSTELTIDRFELQDARWFSRSEIVQMMTRLHPEGLFVPPPQAIAHQLLKTWVKQTAYRDEDAPWDS